MSDLSAAALLGAVLGLGGSAAMVLWVRRRYRVPFPSAPHAFDPDQAVRFIGTAIEGKKVAGWPRGQLYLDEDCALIRADWPPGGGIEVLVGRDEVHAVRVERALTTRVVRFVDAHGEMVGDARFGAASGDPAAALARLGWPVEA